MDRFFCSKMIKYLATINKMGQSKICVGGEGGQVLVLPSTCQLLHHPQSPFF